MLHPKRHPVRWVSWIALCCASAAIGGCPSSPLTIPGEGFAAAGSAESASGRPAGGTVPSETPPTPARDADGDGAEDSPAPGESDLPTIEADGFADPSAPAPGSGSDGSGGIQSGTLTAGSFDDHLNFDVFRAFLSDLMQSDSEGSLPAISLGKRFVITVRNESGDPINDARVIVSLADSNDPRIPPLLNVTTRSDGRVVFLTGIDGGGQAGAFSVTVEPPDGGAPVSASFGIDESAWDVTLQGVASSLPAQLDLAFVVDATGSMQDELEFLKIEIDAIAAAVADRFPQVDQRYALIVYRDDGDEYVTRTFDFDASLEEFGATLRAQRANGGGDYPEAMHLALEETTGLSWRANDTARVMFLIADAPPHSEFAQRSFDAVLELRKLNLAIYPIAASGAAVETELIMRASAMLTLSEYLFLTDDSGVGNSHDEPSIPCYHVERLDRLMIRMIAGELTGQRLQPDPEHIIRTIGNPVDGVCKAPAEDGGG